MSASAPPTRSPRIPLLRGDLVALGVALAIIVISGVTGFWLNGHGYDLVLPTPPLLAFWHPHVGWGTPLVVISVLVGLRLQRVAATMPWRRLLLAGWLLALGWLVSLILIDGLKSGWVDVLLDPNEYLSDLPRITDAHTFLITFSDRIEYGSQPTQAWTTHVAGHPPLATLVFYGLARIGLAGGFWAGTACILASSAVAVALPVTVRALAGDAPARRLVPLIALFPGAVWMGVSADGLFAGVASSGLALVAVAASGSGSGSGAGSGTGPGAGSGVGRRLVLGVLGGLLLGATLYLSYGLVLLGVVVATAFVLTLRAHGRSVLPAWIAAVVGVLIVAVIFFALGFNWFTGLARLHQRYVTTVASQRPYAYFVYANLGAFLISCSPLLAVGILRSVQVVRSSRTSRSARTLTDRSRGEDLPVALLCLAGTVAALLADITGLSKAETERIWLSFGIYAYAGLALLTGRSARWALVGAAATAILVNHLLDTGW